MAKKVIVRPPRKRPRDNGAIEKVIENQALAVPRSEIKKRNGDPRPRLPNGSYIGSYKETRAITVDQQRMDTFFEALAEGNYIGTALACANIPKGNYHRWMTSGKVQLTRGESTVCAQFYQRVKETIAGAERKALKHWETQMPKNWAAAATFLERRHPSRWAKKDKVEVQHKGTVQAEFVVARKLLERDSKIVDAAFDEVGGEGEGESDGV